MSALAIHGYALAQQPLKDQIAGTWLVVSQYVEQDGKKVEPFGSQPQGQFVFHPNGRFSIILMRSGLPRVASNNRLTPTPDEMKAIATGTLAYFGTYNVIDAAGGVVAWKVDASTYPNWTGEEQKRIMSVKGDELRITNPTAAIGAGTVHVVLKRAK